MKRIFANKLEQWEKSTKELQTEALQSLEGLRIKNQEVQRLMQENSEMNAIEVDLDHHKDLLSKLKPKLYELNKQVLYLVYFIYLCRLCIESGYITQNYT